MDAMRELLPRRASNVKPVRVKKVSDGLNRRSCSKKRLVRGIENGVVSVRHER